VILADVEVDGRRVDVALDGERIAEVGPGLARAGRGDVLDGHGGTLLPGLHDHHLHAFSLAARDDSVVLEGVDRPGLDAALGAAARHAAPGRWIRAVGYDDHAAGPIDRHDLDRIAPDHLVRVQHRSGAQWILSSKALAATGRRGDGRVFGGDLELRASWGGDRPDLGPLGRRLAAHGVTGVTDATVTNAPDDAVALASGLAQRVLVMGGPDLAAGPRKVVVAEHDIPDPGDLSATIAAAHAVGRPVAIHAASRATLVLALRALEAAGARPGDRIEHASVAPPELVAWMARLGVTVVTQPNFVAQHGDRYLDHVDRDDQPWLYRLRGLLDAGVPLAAGTDAPFGDPDPWFALRAAVSRRTREGAVLGPDERLAPEEALALFTGAATSPGGPSRTVAEGEPADLCLLRAPWAEAREVLTSDLVAATIIGGRLVDPDDGR
jgi:predicted amidohydrolase YtcJ